MTFDDLRSRIGHSDSVAWFSKTTSEDPGILQMVGAMNETVLHWAASAGDDELIKVLARKTLNVNPQDENGFTPRHYARTSGQVTAERVLIDLGAKFSIFDLVALGELEELKKLLRESPSLAHEKQKSKWTPIFFAKRLDIAEALLSHGASLDEVDDDGYTALHAAAGWSDETVIDLFLSKKCPVNAKTSAGFTPLHEAVEFDRVDAARLLLERGADVNAQNNARGSALMIAAEKANRPMVETLLAYGANTESKDVDGNRAEDFAKHNAIRALIRSKK